MSETEVRMPRGRCLGTVGVDLGDPMAGDARDWVLETTQ